MSRVRRLLVSHRIFFVTVNLRRSLPFLREEALPLVVEALAESRRRMEFLLCGYVVLPDHWHALIRPPPPRTISRAVQSVKWQAASLLNRKRGRRGTVWQHQSWDRFGRNDEEFNERLEYMHLNPVGKGLVRHPEDWRWSSYSNFWLDRAKVEGCPTCLPQAGSD
jgi:putative transposase